MSSIQEFNPDHCPDCGEPMRSGRCLVGWDSAHVPGGARVIVCRECGERWYPMTRMRTMTPAEYRRAYRHPSDG